MHGERDGMALGPAVLPDSSVDPAGIGVAVPRAGVCVDGSVLWGFLVLSHELVWGGLVWGFVFEARGVLLLWVLCFYECFLDRYSYL